MHDWVFASGVDIVFWWILSATAAHSFPISVYMLALIWFCVYIPRAIFPERCGEVLFCTYILKAILGHI